MNIEVEQRAAMEARETAEKHENESVEPNPPHEALLYFALSYLPLFELLSMCSVCSSLRYHIRNDVLLWLNIVVDKPVNLGLSDSMLVRITSMAHGRLSTLALLNCSKITDNGLLSVVQHNPLITKLHIPSCTGLTPEGVIVAVKTLTEHQDQPRLRSLRINGIYNFNKDHFEILRLYMNDSDHQNRPLLYHHEFKNDNSERFRDEMAERSIDVEVCPKCKDVRTVFDCPREDCNNKCRGCEFCIPRCYECGICLVSVPYFEVGETVCGDSVCPDCWLKLLPKCSLCNQPYCKLHANQMNGAGDTELICHVCDTHDWFIPRDE